MADTETSRVTGGDKLESALRDIAQQVTKPATLQVGFLAGATYPDGKPVAMIAAIQEYGAPSRGIPPRPFFRNMIAEHSDEWPEALMGLLKANNYDPERSLEILGHGIAGQLRDSIVKGPFIPLKPATVKAKGFDTPLVDTGHMLQSIDSKVNT
jgi:hypothetical protein